MFDFYCFGDINPENWVFFYFYIHSIFSFSCRYYALNWCSQSFLGREFADASKDLIFSFKSLFSCFKNVALYCHLVLHFSVISILFRKIFSSIYQRLLFVSFNFAAISITSGVSTSMTESSYSNISNFSMVSPMMVADSLRFV